jgi:hypothetical protein
MTHISRKYSWRRGAALARSRRTHKHTKTYTRLTSSASKCWFVSFQLSIKRSRMLQRHRQATTIQTGRGGGAATAPRDRYGAHAHAHIVALGGRRNSADDDTHLCAVARYALLLSNEKRVQASVYSTWFTMERWMVCTSASLHNTSAVDGAYGCRRAAARPPDTPQSQRDLTVRKPTRRQVRRHERPQLVRLARLVILRLQLRLLLKVSGLRAQQRACCARAAQRAA